MATFCWRWLDSAIELADVGFSSALEEDLATELALEETLAGKLVMGITPPINMIYLQYRPAFVLILAR